MTTKTEANIFSTAFKLHTLGYSVIPSGGGDKGKAPIVTWTEFQHRQATDGELENWQAELEPRLWGIVTGAISGVVVADADTPDARKEFEAEIGPPHVITPRGGAHWYFNHPGHSVKTVAGLLPGVDMRGDGGFVNIVGVSKDGDYQIAAFLTPDTLIPWHKLPERIKAALDDSKPAPQATRGEGILEGQRNQRLASFAGSMRYRGMTQSAIEAALLEVNIAQCQPPLPKNEVLAIVKSVARYASSVSSTPWPEPLADEAFYGLAGEVVRAIEPHTEGDVAAILTNFLVSFGNSIGRGAHARAEADRHSCNLNIVQVGETSKGRKGSAWGHIRELFSRVDPEWTEQRIASGLSSGEGLIWEVRDPIEKMVKGEVMVVDAGMTDKRLLVCEAEFSAPLKVMTREGNTLSATIRQAWDSGVLRILTKNSPAKATGAHISILGHVTKAELLRYLNDIEAGNGFANRFLWVCVKRSGVLPEGGGRPDYASIIKRLHDTLESARNLGELRRDTEAKRLWADIYPELSEGKTGLFGAVTARAEAQVLRLSILYAALDGDSEIRPAHLMAALAVWDYCEASARYIFGDALGDPVADRILDMLRQSPKGLSRTSIYQLFSKHTPAARIEQALGLLQTTRRARCEVKETEGRPAEVWRAA